MLPEETTVVGQQGHLGATRPVDQEETGLAAERPFQKPARISKVSRRSIIHRGCNRPTHYRNLGSGLERINRVATISASRGVEEEEFPYALLSDTLGARIIVSI